MAENSLFGNLMGGVSSIGRGILNIPTNIGKKYEAGTLFGGGGALGDLLGQQARQEAQRQAIMKLGLGLLGQGPSRTPISFGQSLASGLLGAQEAYRKDLQTQLGDAATLMSLEESTNPEFVKMNIDGSDVLVDTNPKSKTYKQIINPGASIQTDLAAISSQETVDQQLPTPDEIAKAPTIDDAAQGDLGGLFGSTVRGVFGALGGEAMVDQAKARDYVNNVNKEMQVELVRDLGGKLTKVVASTIEEIMPKPSMNDANFRSKTEQLISFSRERISEIKSKLPTMNRKEQKEAQSVIDGINRRVRKYEAMIEKTKQFKTGTGFYGKEQKTTEQLLNEYESFNR